MTNNTIVHITDLNEDGIGFGHITLSNNELRKVSVPYTYPGDEVEIRIYRKRHKKWEGDIVQFIKQSEKRSEPFCPHFTVCGGCLTQQIPYVEQLELKKQKVEKLLGSSTLPILSSPLTKGYRNKMEFSFSQDKKGEKYLGLYGRRRVQNVKICPISPGWFSDALGKIRTWWDETELTAFNPRSGLGSLRTITFREGDNSKMAILTVSGDPQYALSRDQIKGYINALSSYENISIFLKIHQAIKGQPTQFFEMHLKGPDTLTENLAGATFKISPAAFFQPNPRQAERLYETALSFLSSDIKVVYDLYCGTGTLSILLAKKGYEVYGIELSREACLDARENGELNEVDNLTILNGDVGQVLASNELKKPDAVVVDPPRTGLNAQAIEQIVKVKPREILYISCNPETQARDVLEFKKQGYECLKAQPVDQFPHTPHIENIVLLTSVKNG